MLMENKCILHTSRSRMPRDPKVTLNAALITMGIPGISVFTTLMETFSNYKD
jgi:hypothetical protein